MTSPPTSSSKRLATTLVIPFSPMAQITAGGPSGHSHPSSPPPPPSPTPVTVPSSPTDTSRTLEDSPSPVSPEMLHHLSMRLPSALGCLRNSSSEVHSSPHISTSHRASSFPVPGESSHSRSRHIHGSSHYPRMSVRSSPSKHTFTVHLPSVIQPEMVTVSANRGDRLKVIADAWHVENDCHYEWQISFPPYDANMSSVHAKFDPDGRLTIDVLRLQRYM